METFDFSDNKTAVADPKELDFLSKYKTMEVDSEPESFNPPAASEPVTEVYKRGPKKGQPKPAKKSAVSYNMEAEDEISGDIIDGAMLILLIDMVIPLCVVGLHNSFSKTTISIEELQLEPSQLKKLEPLCNKVVAYLKLRANPLTILIIALVCMYAVKYVAIKAVKK